MYTFYKLFIKVLTVTAIATTQNTPAADFITYLIQHAWVRNWLDL